jgi:long-chain acyl-CoA synthetase
MPTNEPRHPELISSREAVTLSGLFRRRAAKTPDTVAYRQYDHETGLWRDHTWQQTLSLVNVWRQALLREGFAPGERVALQLKNSLEWVCFDQAALSLGLVVVPLYMADTPENTAYILEDSAARLLLLDAEEQWLALRPHYSGSLQRVVGHTRQETATADDGTFTLLDEWLSGSATESMAGLPEEDREASPHALATIIYTSGTTGRPKGVMLSHHNILWNAETVLKAIPCYREDLFLSFLPLSHTFERTVGYYLPVMAGSCVAFARSIQELGDDLLVIRPTVFVSVPRIFERVFAKIQQQLAEKGKLAALLFKWAVAVGWQRFEAGQGRGKQVFLQQLFWPVLRRLMADRILARLGGRVRIAVSGGAPLDATIARCFTGLGLTLLQGYGLTEASPVISTNLPEKNLPTSVGPPLPGIACRIGDNDELLVRAPSVMLGYWNSPEETRRVLDADGWLHTGDQAELSDGYLFIRGRIKDILVMSTGEKVSPADLERAILQDALFDMALVVGENKPFLTALIVLNQAEWGPLAGSLALAGEDPAALQAPQVSELVLAKIARLLQVFPGQSRVRAVYLTLEPWTIDNGLLTPTLKLKRAKLEKRFAAQIHELYAAHEIPL